ncbi:MAG: NAD(P)H-dependent glycerol-3-phosphate dehydrogenase [Bdellovibrionia bacterium]
MTLKDFWSNSTVGVVGGGSWGSVLASLASRNCREVRLWLRREETARSINSTRTSPGLPSEVQFKENVHAFSSMDRVFEGGVHLLIWALPSSVTRDQARCIAPLLQGDELVIHGTKGIEQGSLKRVSEILEEELPCRRIGVMSGPNLAGEIIRGDPAASVVASSFQEVIEAGRLLFENEKFGISPESDVIGVEWAGALKNIFAIASGALDGLNLGWNTRATILTHGLSEMVRFGQAMGAKERTFLGLAGVGDLLATCNSSLSRNYRVGKRLAQGETLEEILDSMESTAEGVQTTQTVWEFAVQQKIPMPITHGVYDLLRGGLPPMQVLQQMMGRSS